MEELARAVHAARAVLTEPPAGMPPSGVRGAGLSGRCGIEHRPAAAAWCVAQCDIRAADGSLASGVPAAHDQEGHA